MEMKSSLKDSASLQARSRTFCRDGGHGGLGVGTGDLGELGDGGVGAGEKLLHADARAFEDWQDDALAVFQQGGEQVHGQDFGVAVLGGEGRGGLDGLLRLDGQFFPLEWHSTSLDAHRRMAACGRCSASERTQFGISIGRAEAHPNQTKNSGVLHFVQDDAGCRSG